MHVLDRLQFTLLTLISERRAAFRGAYLRRPLRPLSHNLVFLPHKLITACHKLAYFGGVFLYPFSTEQLVPEGSIGFSSLLSTQ